MKRVLLFAAGLAVGTATLADEARPCRSKDMNGDWVAYQNAVVVNPHTGVCKFNVKDVLVSGDCEFSTGFAGPFAGTATVQKDCSVELTMDFAPVPVVSRLHLQLHRDRQSFAGRWDNNFQVLGTTNGIKR